MIWRNFKFWIITLSLLNFADLLLTSYMSRFSWFLELNPLMHIALNYGIIAFVIAKLTLIGVIIYSGIKAFQKDGSIWHVRTATFIYTFTVGVNIWILARA